GRYNEFLHHPAIHGGELAASYTYGLNSPRSPEVNRRENWWYYSQSGPGVYQGDVYFYSLDWDAREDIRRIDTNRCKVALLTGEYDYSCTPAMSEAVAASIPSARLTIMQSMGHFPMIENYPAFRPYLIEALDHVAGWAVRSSLPPSAFREPRTASAMAHVQNLDLVHADAVKDLVVVSPDDLDTNRRVGRFSRAQRLIHNIADCRVDGVNDLTRSRRIALIEVAKDLFEVGESKLPVSHFHARPKRFQNARTFSSEATGLLRAASIAACSSSLST